MKKLMVGVLCSVVASGLLAARKGDVKHYPVAVGSMTVHALKGDTINIYDYKNTAKGKYFKVEYPKQFLKQVHKMNDNSLYTFEVEEDGNFTLKIVARKKHKRVGDRLIKEGHKREVMKMKVQDH